LVGYGNEELATKTQPLTGGDTKAQNSRLGPSNTLLRDRKPSWLALPP